MDFLRQLAVCYNRRANADKNEVALRTEEFINERVEKINEELGLTEDELADYKRRHSMTGLSMDATQAVQLSNQFLLACRKPMPRSDLSTICVIMSETLATSIR